jgi:hypothetical protein
MDDEGFLESNPAEAVQVPPGICTESVNVSGRWMSCLQYKLFCSTSGRDL